MSADDSPPNDIEILEQLVREREAELLQARSAATAVFAALIWGAALGHLQWLAAKPFVLIGVCSYSIYLLHDPLRLIAEYIFDFPWAPFVSVPAFFLFAYVSYRVIEIPAQRWANNWSRNSPPENVIPLTELYAGAPQGGRPL